MSNRLLAACGATDPGPDTPIPFHRDVDRTVVRRIHDLKSTVDGLMGEWIGARGLLYDRKSYRVVARQFFGLTPLCDDTWKPIAESYRVQAFDLSTDGVSFMHQKTLPYRLVAATFQLADGGLATVMTRLKWCRFTRTRSYRSGGHFLRTIHLGR
ncbi:MAG: hypothetical protein ACE5KM_14105, partial [Planctomycetaceae bacterium]